MYPGRWLPRVTTRRREGGDRVNPQRLNGHVAAAAAVWTILRAAPRELAFRAPRLARAVRKASASRTRSLICDLAISPLSIGVSERREPFRHGMRMPVAPR